MPSTGASVPNTTEYDMTVDWRFDGVAAADDQGSAGNTTDYRVIVNYPWQLH